MWALFTVLIMNVHEAPFSSAALMALRMITNGALLGLGVHAFTGRLPWPHPFRLSFLLIQLFAAALYATLWTAACVLVESLLRGDLSYAAAYSVARFLFTGAWLYLTIASVAYAQQATRRAAMIQAATARAQLAALHAQLHPHFLFNALHTVVQLIPLAPDKASLAAEQLAELLRTALDEKRDLVTLAEEWHFVERYLAIEQLRFGERLLITATLPTDLMAAKLPAFSLQTLVENAVRHGAAPKIGATHLKISASAEQKEMRLVVSDDGIGTEAPALSSQGTGLRRLRERLDYLYGSSAVLTVDPSTPGVTAVLCLPLAACAATSTESADDD
jgi:LytS/YehU family sensor histidine kinase